MNRKILVVGLGLLACDKEQPVSEPITPEVHEPSSPTSVEEKEAPVAAPLAQPASAVESGDRGGAEALLRKFLEPDAQTARLSAELIPLDEDFKAVFAPTVAVDMAKAYAPMFESLGLNIKPNPGQTELLLVAASTEQLRAGEGNAGEFPGGYREVANALREGVTWYRFKFVKPGETIGMAYDGLTFVDGRWVIFPKPWRAYREVSSAK